jgi:hypothetical protein
MSDSRGILINSGFNHDGIFYKMFEKLCDINEKNEKRIKELEEKCNKQIIPKYQFLYRYKSNGEFKPMIIDLNSVNIVFKLYFLRDNENYSISENVLIFLLNGHQLFDLNTDLSNNEISNFLKQINNSTIVFNLNDRNCNKLKNNYCPYRNNIKDILDSITIDKEIIINTTQEIIKLPICQDIINCLATNNKMKKIEIHLIDMYIINTRSFYNDETLNKLKKHCVDNNIELKSNIGL